MSINIETTTTQQTTSDELDQLAKHLCGVKLTLSDSGVPTIQADSISTNGITASTTNTYSDTVAALALKGVTVNYTNQNLRILDPNVKSVLLANNIGDGTYITPAQAAAASISNLLKSNTSIIAFDEFKYFTAANASATSFDGCTSLQRIDLSNCTNYCDYMFRNCSNLEYFNGADSTSGVLTIPSGTTSIGEFTFSGLPKLTNVVFPSSIQSLDWYTFYNDSNLAITNLSLPNLSYLGNGIFYNTKIETVSDLGHITSISTDSFRGCTSLTAVNIPSAVTSIGSFAFYGDSNLSSFHSSAEEGELNLPNLREVQARAFAGTKLKKITSLGTCTSLYESFIDATYLESATLPNTLTNISNRAFYSSGLKSLVVPDSVTEIGWRALCLCDKLQSITFGSGLQTIGSEILLGANVLQSITVTATTPPTFSGSSTNPLGLPNGILNTVNIYVPSSVVSTYQAASGWSSYASRIQAIPT